MNDAAIDQVGANRYELAIAVRYGMRLDELHRRLYGRLSTVISVVLLVAGSTAFATLFGGSAALAGWAGLIVACVTAIDVRLSPAVRASMAAASARRFGELRAIVHDHDLDDIRGRLAALQAESLDGEIDALRWVAWNDVMREAGHFDQVKRAGYWQRLIAVCA